MSKIETICPYCKKTNAVEKHNSGVGRYALQKIRCAHCLKNWETDLSETNRLEKSAQPGREVADLAVLRVQVRAQLDELVKRINGLVESRAAAASRRTKFDTNGVEKSDAADQELQKALADGKPVKFQPSESSSPRFQTVESVGSGRRVRSGAPFDTNGVEKSDGADQELRKALANGKPVGFIPHDN